MMALLALVGGIFVLYLGHWFLRGLVIGGPPPRPKGQSDLWRSDPGLRAEAERDVSGVSASDVQECYGRGRRLAVEEQTLEELRVKAEQGDAEAQYIVGLMHAYGTGTPQNDVEAVLWFRLAVNQGHAGAQYNLGVLYNFGEGVPRDYVEAARLFRARESSPKLVETLHGP